MRVAVAVALAGLVRAPARSVVRIAVLAAAVALVGAMVLFIGHSLRTMTGSAVRSVPVDWQGPVASYSAAKRVAVGVARQPGVLEASPTATAPFAGVTHRGPAGTTRAGAGAVLAVPPGYSRQIHAFRFLEGRLRPDQVVLDQQLAATLQARVGDTVVLTPRRGVRPRAFKVSGLVLVTAPDVLFQPLNPLLGPAPAQPPADIAILPLATFASHIAPSLPAISRLPAASASVPGAQAGVQWEVQAQVDPRALAGTPTDAYRRAGQIVGRVERSLPGQVQFVDNLSDQLSTAAGDALYAQALYIMLAVPGALVALGLAYLAALGTVERDRRDLALLRARGAGRRHLLAIAAVESAAMGAVAGLLGAGIALAAVTLVIKGGVGLTPGRAALTAVVCILLAVAGALAARLGATASSWRASVLQGRRTVQRQSKPLWQRLYVDLGALVVGGLIYWLTARTGFSAVVNPDSNPTLSLSIYMFFGPALLWIGTALLLVRTRGRLLTWIARRAGGRRPTTLRGFLLASAGRRGGAINRGLLLVGLLLAFGVNLGIFAATYDQQSTVDAQLTLGADVTATAPPGAVARHDLAARIAAVPGVRATTAVDHSYAYVGPDLQDTYGVDPATIARATTLRDSYFLGGTVHDVLARLRSTRDGILVSKETIADYQLKVGDLLKLRVLDHRTGRFRVVPFHVVGVVQEFPSAPRDSFMVANLPYLQAADRAGGPNVVFAKTSEDATIVGRRIGQLTRADGVAVKDIGRQTQQTASSITTVDLAGISGIERAFTIALAAAAMALFVTLAVSERRQELATMAAVGARLRHISAFVWTEAALVLGASLALAAGLGWLLSEVLVAMLQHVFDPPPDSLAIPWGYLAGLATAAVGAGVIAAGIAAGALRRLPLGQILREQ